MCLFVCVCVFVCVWGGGVCMYVFVCMYVGLCVCGGGGCVCLCLHSSICLCMCVCLTVSCFTARNSTCQGRRIILHDIRTANATYPKVLAKCQNNSQSVVGHYLAEGQSGSCLQTLLRPIADELNHTSLYVRAENLKDGSNGLWKINPAVQGTSTYSLGLNESTAYRIVFAVCTDGKLIDVLL